MNSLAPATSSLYDLVGSAGVSTIAVIGLAKNAGKTTVVNALLDRVPLRFGLTSLGLDGERTDHLTGLAKPRIVPPAGTLVATTEGSLARSHATLADVEALPFHTSLGDVVIGSAPGDCAIEVSGPVTLADVAATTLRLHDRGAGVVLVDGAINRLGSASPRVSDAVIVATGAMVADSFDEAIEITAATLDLLTLPVPDASTLSTLDGGLPDDTRAVAIDGRGSVRRLDIDTAVGHGVMVARELDRLDAQTLFLGGAVTGEFAEDLARTLSPRRRLTLVVRDATVLLLPAATLARLRRRGVDVRVLEPLRVLAVTTNPYRMPRPYEADVFFGAVAAAVGDRAPVFDVVNGLSMVPDGYDVSRGVTPS